MLFFRFYVSLYYAGHGGAVVSTVASQQEHPGFESESGHFYGDFFHVLPVPAWVFSGYSASFPSPKPCKAGVRLIGECEWLFVSLCQPCNGQATCPRGPLPSQEDAEIGSSHP